MEIYRILATIGFFILAYFIGNKMDEDETIFVKIFMGSLVLILSTFIIMIVYAFFCSLIK
jgi:hypothetical protein